MIALLSSFNLTFTSTKPASSRYRSRDAVSGAPATQHASASAVRNRSGTAFDGSRTTTSLTAILPPDLSMRYTSRKTCALSGLKLMTQLLMTQSTVSSAIGRCSISPRRNCTFLDRRADAFCLALYNMSGVMSTPITNPSGPTRSDARKQSTPAPHPRSTIVSPSFGQAKDTGLPQPRPRFASFPAASICSGV